MAKFFVEIGAANFDTLLPLAQQGWHGYVIEPIPHLYDQLVDMFEPYPVEIFNCAISDFNGKATMAVANDNSSWLTGCSHIVDDHHMGFKLSTHPDRANDFDRKITVDCVTLDALLKDVNHIDFMKVDTEGHEMNIFRAYSFRVKPSFIKVEHKHINDLVMAARLEANGYLVWTENDDIYGIT